MHERLRGICGDPECRRQDVAHQLDRRRESTQAEARLLAHRQVASLPVVILPASRSGLAPLPEARRARFLAHLDEVFGQAASEREAGTTNGEETASPTSGVTREETDLPIIGAACGLCAGRCCEPGGDTAFLEAATLHRVLRDHPDTDLAQLHAEYVERLPETVRVDSCVYHTATGCALPRDLRSRTCNQYLCPEIAELVRVWKINGGQLLVGSADGTMPDRVAIADGDRIGSVYDRTSARGRTPESASSAP